MISVNYNSNKITEIKIKKENNPKILIIKEDTLITRDLMRVNLFLEKNSR